MGRRKNLTSVLVQGPGLVTIILMGLIVSMIIWHELKGLPTREKRDENRLDEPPVNMIASGRRDREKYRKWWRSPYESKEIVMNNPEVRNNNQTRGGAEREDCPPLIKEKMADG